MRIQSIITHHMVKYEDLNHHGTLYAGRSAEWFVESGFFSAAQLTSPENIVCLQIHGMTFSRPVLRGEVVQYESKIVLAGRTKLVSYIRMTSNEQLVVEGFITFIHVDAAGHPTPHGIVLDLTSPEDIEINRKAGLLFTKATV